MGSASSACDWMMTKWREVELIQRVYCILHWTSFRMSHYSPSNDYYKPRYQGKGEVGSFWGMTDGRYLGLFPLQVYIALLRKRVQRFEWDEWEVYVIIRWMMLSTLVSFRLDNCAWLLYCSTTTTTTSSYPNKVDCHIISFLLLPQQMLLIWLTATSKDISIYYNFALIIQLGILLLMWSLLYLITTINR